MSVHATPALALCYEMELLLICARVNLAPDRAERVRALLQEDLDWETIIEQAMDHGTLALLYQNLQKVDPDAVPQVVMDQLQTYFHSIAQHNLRLTHELVKLLWRRESVQCLFSEDIAIAHPQPTPNCRSIQLNLVPPLETRCSSSSKSAPKCPRSCGRHGVRYC